MGQIVRKKRRGRPSNTDRARRNTFLAPPSPVVDRRRSRRRRNVKYSFEIDDYVDDDEFYDDDDEDEEVIGRREKKIRLLLCEEDDDDDSRSQRRVVHAPSYSSSEDCGEEEEEDDGKALKKRKIDEEEYEDNEIEEIRGRKLESEDEEEEAGGTNFVCGTASDLRKDVTLPDKKTLQFILDKLQKKDIYGVYAEPVDPEELPDYHDVIKHPMDFATIRKKLAKGAYLTLNAFENDVLLLCKNAMQYNAPDTIYYKQASSIQEQAKLRFQRLRVNDDRSEIELKTEQKTTPGFSKQVKKSVAENPQDPVGSEALLNGSAVQTPVRLNSGEVLMAENSSLAENNLDKEQELLPGKGFISKLGRKPSVHDENRRATYNISVQPVPESNSIFSTFEDESKHFIPVGLHSDHSYARSLARFAATLGSVAWKVASQTIEQALPEGVKFGRGWVGEYEPLSTPVLMPENCSIKEPDFHSNFKIDKKSSKHTTSIDDDKARKTPPVNNGLNKDPRPPFFSSLQVNPRNFNGLEKAGPPRVEPKPNHLLPTPVSSVDFVSKRVISKVSDIPSPTPGKPVSQNGNLTSLASFNHPNGTNDGFTPKGKPSPVFQDSNRMVPIDNNLPYQQERKPTSVVSRDFNRMVPMDHTPPFQQERKLTSDSRDYNRMVHMDRNSPFQQEQKPTSDSRDHNRMVPMDRNSPFQQEQKSTSDSRDFNRTVPMDRNPPFQQERKPTSDSRDYNRTVPMDHNPSFQQERKLTSDSRDYNRTVPMDHNPSFQQERKPTSDSRDYNRRVPMDHNPSFQQERKPTSDSRDYNRMVPMDHNPPFQQERKPTSDSRDYNRMVPMDHNPPFQQERKPTSVSRDYNRMAPMDHNLPNQQQQSLNDPVHMMKMLAEKKAQHQQNNSNGFGSPVGPKREEIHSDGSQIGLKREDSRNVALTAAQAWMSLGGTAAGGFIKPPLAENPNPHKTSTESLYNDRQQPQVSHFRGEFPVPSLQTYPGIQTYQHPPVRTINEARYQNQNRHSGFPQLVTADLSRFQGQPGWRGVAPQLQNPLKPKQQESRPPDLNVGYQSMGSPVRQSTGMLVDSQQPDLALQL